MGTIIVIILFGLAVFYLYRRYSASFKKASTSGGYCGACGACGLNPGSCSRNDGLKMFDKPEEQCLFSVQARLKELETLKEDG